ncbi:MAG: CPBP family intramembrane metalloprotease, partial [Dysgonamonadaceae bacterium]|nr:CPBP family intramembrane metalloprotease [Dysgonamonadaceae bacterium]
MLKGLLKDVNGFIQLLFTLILSIGGAFVGTFLFLFVLLFFSGKDLSMFNNLAMNFMQDANLVRIYQFISQVFTFILPAVAGAWLFSDKYKTYLKLDTPVYLPTVLWTIFGGLVIIPFLNLVTYLNMQMTLPDSLKFLEDAMRNMEDQANKLMELMLNTDNFSVFILNILIVAVFAAISEELMFRGLCQNIVSKIFSNKHIVIWIVAILFSAIHLQFYGFFTRMLIGAWLGYLVYMTGSLWIPIIAHFTNN